MMTINEVIYYSLIHESSIINQWIKINSSFFSFFFTKTETIFYTL